MSAPTDTVVWECPHCLVDLFESGPCWCCGLEIPKEINRRPEPHPVEGSAPAAIGGNAT